MELNTAKQMNMQLQSNSNLCLRIGTNIINIVNLQEQDVIFTQKALPFLSDNDIHNSNQDIKVTIQLEDDFKEPQGAPVESLDESSHPYRLYECDNGGYIWIRRNYNDEIKLVYRISKDWNNWKLVVDNLNVHGIDSFEEMVYLFAYSVLKKKGILFHGVVMEWNKMGIIVCAHSGVGKTTHTRMWRDQEGTQILNGDRALCCMEENRWYTYGAPWCGSSGEYKNQRVDLNAIVILEQAEVNEVILLNPLQGALELIQLAFAPTWEVDLMNAALDDIDSIVQTVPIYKLRCRPDREAVEVLKKELKKLNKYYYVSNDR